MANLEESDWPYSVDRPGKGEVRACPRCGQELIFTCYHEGHDYSAKVMPAADAARLRREFTCPECHRPRPGEFGFTTEAQMVVDALTSNQTVFDVIRLTTDLPATDVRLALQEILEADG